MFGFLVAHGNPGNGVDKLEMFGLLKKWLEQRPAKVDRCGGRNGKVVRFNERRFLNALESNGDENISLYSERIWGKGEVDEFLNCGFSAGYSSDDELLLSSDSSRLDLKGLVQSFWGLGEVLGNFDYAYAYNESQAFGFGYGLGVSMLDDAHPLSWDGHARVGMWRKMQRADKLGELIRDVYPFNAFSRRKIEALPEGKRQALTQAMKQFGECSAQSGFFVWTLEETELVAVRDYLKDFNLLASYL